MAERSNSSVYIGNLDEKVSERVLYDILIQAGRVVDLHIPKEKGTSKQKNFAFAEYESEEVAEYAVKLFSGLITLYRKTLKFAISGQDKISAITPAVISTMSPRLNPVPYNNEISPQSGRYSENQLGRAQVPPPSDTYMHPHNGYRSHHDSTDYGYSRRVLGTSWDSVDRPRSGRYDTRHHPYY